MRMTGDWPGASPCSSDSSTGSMARCADEARARLERDVSRSFGALEQGAALPALRRLEAGEALDPALVELGVIPPEVRVETFYEAIETVVLPRLSRLGFDGRRAWDARYRG